VQGYRPSARGCKSSACIAPQRAQQRHQAPAACSTSTTTLQLGDPTTRPDDDHYFVPTTYDIEASLHEWESTAAISWSLTGPPSTGPKEIEVAIRDEFRLRLGKVLVTRHHPEGPPGDARY
jgi:hypothetical protein